MLEAFVSTIKNSDGEIDRFALVIKEPFEMLVDFGYINCKLEYYSSSFNFVGGMKGAIKKALYSSPSFPNDFT